MSKGKCTIKEKTNGRGILIEETTKNVEFNKIIVSKIKNIVIKHSLTEPDWTKAISSQNFLVDLACDLELKSEQSFKDLMNIFLKSFSPQFDGGFELNKENILIIPDENQKLIDCMKEEDKKSSFYLGRLKADNIENPDIIYKNYLYGMMINISTTVSNHPALYGIFRHCIDELLEKHSLDTQGGWIHYRLPWITARIVTNLYKILNRKFLDVNESELQNKILSVSSNALDSLFHRLYNDNYWRSGAGTWVSKWESTGLCLEAFFESMKWRDEKYINKINEIIRYLLEQEILTQWLPSAINVSNEEETNELLASIILGSVIYRYLQTGYFDEYIPQKSSLELFFEKCIEYIERTEEFKIRQFCTIPQILSYITIAMKGQ